MMSNVQFYADYSNRLNPDCYTVGRAGNPILCMVCHNTAGPRDLNTVDARTAQILSDAAAAYLASNDRQASAHYLIGAENCGAPIYLIVPEKDTAYHAGGNPPQYPSSWKDPKSGKVYGGFALNQVSIGVEVFGQVTDVIGPNQKAALAVLVKDVVTRNTILFDPFRTVSHKEVEPGDRADGVNWRDLARDWIRSGFVQTLPYGAVVDTAGNIHFGNYMIGFGFKDYFLTLGGYVLQGDLAAAINRGVKVFGLPLTNEEKDPATGLTQQRFQRYTLEYDPSLPAEWRNHGAFVN